MKQHSKPCAECPFSCKIEPGALGGSTPQTYIGQAYGPFLLSCHMSPGYWGNPRGTEHAQCAGAAIFRANCGIDVLMPEAFRRLPAGPEAFESPAHLIAHHGQMSLTRAQVFLIAFPPEELLERELFRSSVQIIPKPGGQDSK